MSLILFYLLSELELLSIKGKIVKSYIIKYYCILCEICTLLKERTCDSNRPFKCTDTGRCMPTSMVCDGHHDCTDSSDENVHLCQVWIFFEYK